MATIRTETTRLDATNMNLKVKGREGTVTFEVVNLEGRGGDEQSAQQAGLGRMRTEVPTSGRPLRPLLPTTTTPVRCLADYGGESSDLEGKAKDMAARGRLFIQREENGPLEQATAGDLQSSLDHGVGLVYDVRCVAQHSSGSTSQGQASSRDEGFSFFIFGHREDSSASSYDYAKESKSKDFVSSPIMSWDAFRLADTAPAGLPEVSTLGAPAGNAGTSNWFRNHSASQSFHSDRLVHEDRDSRSQESTSWGS